MDENQSKKFSDKEAINKTPDALNATGVLTRREIEARIVAPLLDAIGEEFGRERVLEVARDVIVNIAHRQGAQLAESMGGHTLDHFAASMEAWKKGDAIEMEVLRKTEADFAFNITRCRYAEMYADLGIPELGVLLSCNRDFALIEGFNADIKLTRTQTIMEGEKHCDFRYELKLETDSQ
jgi:predicted ArsR family transcriptional regulator